MDVTSTRRVCHPTRRPPESFVGDLVHDVGRARDRGGAAAWVIGVDFYPYISPGVAGINQVYAARGRCKVTWSLFFFLSQRLRGLPSDRTVDSISSPEVQ